MAEDSTAGASRDPGRVYTEMRKRVDDLTTVTQKPAYFVGRPLLLFGNAAGNFAALPGRFSGLDLVDAIGTGAPIPTHEPGGNRLLLVMSRDLVVNLRMHEMLPPGRRTPAFVECTPVMVRRGETTTYPCEIVSVFTARDDRVTQALRRDGNGKLVYQLLAH